jgi:hypothetical protein
MSSFPLAESGAAAGSRTMSEEAANAAETLSLFVQTVDFWVGR